MELCGIDVHAELAILPRPGKEVHRMVLAADRGSVANDSGAQCDASDEMVHALARGDAAAMTRAYREHHVAVRLFAQRLLGDAHAADDLVQEVFVALPVAIARFRGECSLRTFLVSIAVNQAKNHVRASVRRRRALAALSLVFKARPPELEQHVSDKQLAARLIASLDELPYEQRVAVVLSEVEERSHAEISSIVGAPEGTVRSRLFHAKRKLRASMGGQE